jgi:hypothetical protein
MTYACPTWEYGADADLFKTVSPAEHSTPRFWKSIHVHTSMRTARGLQNFLRVRLHK